MIKTFLSEKPPFLFSKGGLTSKYPENTLVSFKHAFELGCTGLSVPVRMCSSGEIVVFEGESLEKSAKYFLSLPVGMSVKSAPNKPIEEAGFDELKKYDVGVSFSPDFVGEHIPTLDQVIDLLPPDSYLDVEIKLLPSKKYEPMLKKVIEILSSRMTDDFCPFIISSSNPFVLRYIEKNSIIPTALIHSNDSSLPKIFRNGHKFFICSPRIHKIKFADYINHKKKYRKYFVLLTDVEEHEEKDNIKKTKIAGIISKNAQLFNNEYKITKMN